jgi:hypothetical protein
LRPTGQMRSTPLDAGRRSVAGSPSVSPSHNGQCSALIRRPTG